MSNKLEFGSGRERGAALIVSILTLALLLAITMGISLTAISELGVSNTYANQTRAFQAAEAGLSHATSLVANSKPDTSKGPGFSFLLKLRPGPLVADYLNPTNFNPFVDANSASFAAGSEMIVLDDPVRGHQLKDAVTGATVPDTFYKISVIDDEPSGTSTPSVPNFNPSVTYPERNVVPAGEQPPHYDFNDKIVVYSTGTFANTSITLEGWVGFVPYPAVFSNENIAVNGNAKILGAYGGVHSNEDLAVGGSAYIEQTATATGDYSFGGGGAYVGGFSGGGQELMYIPPFVTTPVITGGVADATPKIQNYLLKTADTILIDPDFAKDSTTDVNGKTGHQRINALEASLGLANDSVWTVLTTGSPAPNLSQEQVVVVRDRDTGAIVAPTVQTPAAVGWKYVNGGGGHWDVLNDAAEPLVENHVFYAVGFDKYRLTNPNASNPNGGNVKITTNMGSAADPVPIAVFSTGSIEITSTPSFKAAPRVGSLPTPELPPFVTVDVLFIAVEDVIFSGNDRVPVFSGIVFAGEQFDLRGNGRFNGQVVGLGNNDVSASPVSSNTITGNYTLTFNGGQALGRVKLMSWRQIKR